MCIFWGWGIYWWLAFTQHPLSALHTRASHYPCSLPLSPLSPLLFPSSLSCLCSPPPPAVRGRSRKEECLLRGASAARVGSQELKCHPGARCAFLTRTLWRPQRRVVWVHSESHCSFVVNTKRQDSLTVTMAVCCSTKIYKVFDLVHLNLWLQWQALSGKNQHVTLNNSLDSVYRLMKLWESDPIS